MRSGLRAGAVALALIASSYGILAATHQSAAAAPPTAGPQKPVQEPPTEVNAADTKTTLPAGSVADVLVDDAHQQVFISMPSTNSVVVADLNGAITRTVTGLNGPGEMTLGPNGGTVYLTSSFGRIETINTTTYAVGQHDIGNGCAKSITYTGGKIWFSHGACSSNSTGGIGVLDPADGTVATGVITHDSFPGVLRAAPDRPQRLVFFSEWFTGVYDVSGEAPATVVTGSPTGSRGNCKDAALISGGDQLVTACGAPYQHEVFNTADLSAATALAADAYPNAVAVSPDGKYVAGGIMGWYDPDIYVTEITDGVPGASMRTYEFGQSHELIPGALAFSATGRLYSVEIDSPGSTAPAVLHVLTDATKYDTSITVTAPKAVQYQGAVNATGTLNRGPGTETTLTLTRTDRRGSHVMAPVPVAADGTFSFAHTPDVTGQVTYALAYAGDDSHDPAQASAKVIMRPRPYDINADGYAETIVGVPGENIRSDANTGMFHVLSGTASGATGSGSRSYDQDTAGVPGSNEDGDMLGYSNASGDFNGDGYADVAVSAGSEDVGSIRDSGVVLVFYGSASGLRTDNVKSLSLSNTGLSYDGYVYFGDALAAGDFNGDGRDDLAMGAAGSYSGVVFVAPGTSSGLSSDYAAFHSNTYEVPGDANESELFGWSLAAGDINGDGRSDLAVGVMFDWEDRGWSTGSVNVLYGSDTGLTAAGAQRFSKDTPGVPGGGGSFNEDKGDVSDQFGNAVVLADFNGDGKADLAVAAAGAPTTGVDGNRKADAGTVTVLYSDGAKIGTTGAIQVTQKTSGMPGNPGANDFLGATMTAGDANGDGAYELAIFSPGDTYVTVVPGASSGLAWGSAKGWTQNSSGIPGSSETGDYWGNSLRFADIKGTGQMALIVGADGENSGKGAITVIYSTNSGLTGTGSTYFSQDSTGISGTAENGDGFGVFY